MWREPLADAVVKHAYTFATTLVRNDGDGSFTLVPLPAEAQLAPVHAILAGDFLLARASEIAASLGTEVAGLLAATIGRLCEGQVRELQDTYNVDRTEARIDEPWSSLR